MAFYRTLSYTPLSKGMFSGDIERQNTGQIIAVQRAGVHVKCRSRLFQTKGLEVTSSVTGEVI